MLLRYAACPPVPGFFVENDSVDSYTTSRNHVIFVCAGVRFVYRKFSKLLWEVQEVVIRRIGGNGLNSGSCYEP